MTDHWIRRELLLLDTETDAAEPTAAHLIQGALVHITPGAPRRDWTRIAAPRRDIPDEAAGVHGIPTARAHAEGVPISQVLTELLEGLAAWNPGNALIGHNVGYDLTVIDHECQRVLGVQFPIRGPVVDTLLLDKRCDKWRKGSRQLSDQCKHYELELGEHAHEALADAVASGQLAWKLVARAKNNRWRRGRWGPDATELQARGLLATDDAPKLHTWQIKWHEEGQRGLAAYFRTPKAVAKINERVATGELTREQGDARIADLPAAADRTEATAVGHWPVHPRARLADASVPRVPAVT